jgi:hypothetical protein
LSKPSEIELASREGADDFVETVGTDFISTNLTAANDEQLICANTMMCMVIDKASPEKIASGIPESELRIFIEHARDRLKTLSADRNWLRSGTVHMRYQLLLQAVVSFSKHPSFLNIFIPNEGMEIVAKLYASRKKNNTPNLQVAGFILRLIGSIISYLTDKGASLEKGFSIIEKTGLVGQFIRCIPLFPEGSSQLVTASQEEAEAGDPNGRHFRCCDCRERWAHQGRSQV